jgi:hypothetical protein
MMKIKSRIKDYVNVAVDKVVEITKHGIGN